MSESSTTTTTSPRPPRRFTYRRRHRLRHNRDYQAVYDARCRKIHGPLVVFARPNDLPHCRLGLSVGRRVGNATVRNRVKRLLRESFRMMQGDWRRGYDIVIVVRPHPLRRLAEYQHWLHKAMRGLDHEWHKRTLREAHRADRDATTS